MQDQTSTSINLGNAFIRGKATETTEELIPYLRAMLATFDAKQKDYGSSNIAKFGLDGVLIRMSDKIERLIHLRSKGADPLNESVKDSYLDLSIYGIIALMCLDGEWKGVEVGGQPSPKD